LSALALSFTATHSFTASLNPQPPPSVRCSAPSALLARETRREVLAATAGLVAWAGIAPHRAVAADEVTLPSGLVYSVVKVGGNGGTPINGDLIAIKFKCVVRSNGAVIDNILDNPEPYYYRVGSGQVLPAVEEAVKMMKSGDTWQLTVPPALGFGSKGRNSSPGKPRVAGDAILDFTLQLVAVPGKDEEILDANGLIE